MANALDEFVVAVFRANDQVICGSPPRGRSLWLQVPYFYGTEASVLKFLKGTLEDDVHHSGDSPGARWNRAFNQKLLTHTTAEATDLTHLLINQLKV